MGKNQGGELEVPSEVILVVDDNPMNLKLMKIVLLQEGYNVFSAANAVEALKSIAAVKPRLIFMDIQMPEISGLELTRQLKFSPSTKDIQIVAITSNHVKGDYEKAMAAGCQDYITKPIDVLKLPEMIREYLRENRQ